MSKNTHAVILAATLLLVAACSRNPDPQAEGKPLASADNGSVKADAASYGPVSAQALTDLCNAHVQAASEKLDALEALQPPYTVASVLVPLNELGVDMAGGFGAASLYVNLSPVAEVRSAGQGCEQAWNEVNTRLGLSRPIYDAVSAVDVSKEDEETRFSVAKLLRDFKRSGVDRDEATRKRVSELQDEILKLGQEFDKNLADDVRHIELDSTDQLAGLPQDYIDAHAPNEAGKIVVTTDYPDAIPFFDYAQDDDARKALRAVYDNRAYPANEALLKELINRRHELANLLGYRNWAHYITEDKMIGSPDRALEFIDQVAELAAPMGEADAKILLQRLQVIDPQAKSVQRWQYSYLDKLVRKEQFEVDNQVIRQYFAYDKVRDGMFDLVSSLFGVSISPWQTETWDPSVEAYEMHEGGKLIGRFYLDMHPRDGKYKHAAMLPVRPGIGGVQVPISLLMCNFPGGDGTAGYMEHYQVNTFLHEFGHLIHSLFAGEQRWVNTTGISTEWDFVEAPSQMLEEWIWDRETLQSFATNDAGEPIPDELVAKMNAARKFGEAQNARQQMFYASLSMGYYNQDPAQLDLFGSMKELQARYSPYDYQDGTHFYANFGHLNGYSAIYYTYMWSQVIATDMFSRFKTEGIRNTKTAADYRRKVLAAGGSRPAAESVEAFLGRPYGFEAFAESLSAD